MNTYYNDRKYSEDSSHDHFQFIYKFQFSYCHLFREKCSFLEDDASHGKFLNDVTNMTIAYKIYLSDSSENILKFIQRMIIVLYLGKKYVDSVNTYNLFDQ